MSSSVGEKYPLHKAILEHDIRTLRFLARDAPQEELDKPDIHGRTPVMLATILGYKDCGKCLLNFGAGAITENQRSWSLVKESITLGDSRYLKSVLMFHDYQRACQTKKLLLALRPKMRAMADFYVEISWEFLTWIRFIKPMFPFDTIKIYKSGDEIRVDTLLDYDSSNACKQVSLIYRFTQDAKIEANLIDREENTAYVGIIDLSAIPKLQDYSYPEDCMGSFFRAPIETEFVDLSAMSVDRAKASGFFSWLDSSEREEEVDGINCRVYNVSNVKVGIKSRFDHLTEEAKKRWSAKHNEMLTLLIGVFAKKSTTHFGAKLVDSSNISHLSQLNTSTSADYRDGVTSEQYLSDASVTDKIGKPGTETLKYHSFHGSLHMAEDYPLNLREHLWPLLDLLSVHSIRLIDVKRILDERLPPGFPVRINIPCFHAVNLQITFKNVNNPPTEECNDDVEDEDTDDCQEASDEDSIRPAFRLKKSLFRIPADYSIRQTNLSLLLDEAPDYTMATAVSRPQAKAPSPPPPPKYTPSPQYNMITAEEDYLYLQDGFMNDDDFDLMQASSSVDYHNIQMAIEHSLVDVTDRAGGSVEITTMTKSAEIRTVTATASVGGDEVEVDDFELAEAIQLSAAEATRRLHDAELEEEELAKAIELSKNYL